MPEPRPRRPRPAPMGVETLRLPGTLLAHVDALAEAEGRTRSEMLRELLREGLRVRTARRLTAGAPG